MFRQEFAELICKNIQIPQEQMHELMQEAQNENICLSQVYLRENLIDEGELFHLQARYLGMDICMTMPELESSSLPLNPGLLDKISYKFCKEQACIPFHENSHAYLILSYKPSNPSAEKYLRKVLKKRLEIIWAPQKIVNELIDSIYEASIQKNQEEDRQVPSSTQRSKSLHEDNLLENEEESQVVRALNGILSEAIAQNASDIHFEPSQNGLRIRYRIDGILYTRSTPAQNIQQELLTRLKVLAKLDIAQKRLPQDGRMKVSLGEKEIDCRLSTTPVLYGERIVLRILDQNRRLLELHALGMNQETQKEYLDILKCREGLVLVTGPTGSGKTSTLYSSLHALNCEEKNIMTIEDPIEYRLDGIAQIAVEEKIQLNFAKGLRHILRQDPDIIMVGEIRDKETAQIAVQASLTGHLVFATLHTNDAASAITRLLDMGIEPYLLSSCLLAVLAQRLVRQLCPHCKKKSGSHFTAQGCEKCHFLGYEGRLAVYEFLKTSSDIKKLINQDPQQDLIKNLAIAQGMSTLKENAEKLLWQGLSSQEEVLKTSHSLLNG